MRWVWWQESESDREVNEVGRKAEGRRKQTSGFVASNTSGLSSVGKRVGDMMDKRL